MDNKYIPTPSWFQNCCVEPSDVPATTQPSSFAWKPPIMQSLFAASALQEATRTWILRVSEWKNYDEQLISMSIFKVLCCPPCHLPLTDTLIPTLCTLVFDWTTWIDTALHRIFVNFAVRHIQSKKYWVSHLLRMFTEKCQHVSTQPHQTEKNTQPTRIDVGFLRFDSSTSKAWYNPPPSSKSYWIITSYHKLYDEYRSPFMWIFV